MELSQADFGTGSRPIFKDNKGNLHWNVSAQRSAPEPRRYARSPSANLSAWQIPTKSDGSECLRMRFANVRVGSRTEVLHGPRNVRSWGMSRPRFQVTGLPSLANSRSRFRATGLPSLAKSGHWTTAVAVKRILALFTTRHLLLFS